MTIDWKISTEPQDYLQSVQYMEDRIAAIKTGEQDEQVWLLEHPSLYTSGTSAKSSDLIEAKFPVFETGRGGQYTYHGPGQRVAYVMLNLKQHQQVPDIKEYVCNLEQWIINTLETFDIKGKRISGRVGIWVTNRIGFESKIAAIGVRVRHWVTYHGISINLNPDLSHFNGIVPCGINDAGVTSFEQLGVNISQEELDEALQEEFVKIFNEEGV
ncbi:MAG: lipoyl(octanoyl) transferase LipB [Pseudomonadota bacterium]